MTLTSRLLHPDFPHLQTFCQTCKNFWRGTCSLFFLLPSYPLLCTVCELGQMHVFLKIIPSHFQSYLLSSRKLDLKSTVSPWYHLNHLLVLFNKHFFFLSISAIKWQSHLITFFKISQSPFPLKILSCDGFEHCEETREVLILPYHIKE